MTYSYFPRSSHPPIAYHARMSGPIKKETHGQGRGLLGNLHSPLTGAPCAHRPSTLWQLPHIQIQKQRGFL